MDPKNFLSANLDSDEDDEDYVPQKGEASDDNDSVKNKYADEVDESQLTGIAQLKAIKRKKDIDDLWASMQEDDAYYKKKTSANTTNEKT